MLTSTKDWLDWIELKDKKQCEWALTYLNKHSISSDQLRTTSDIERINKTLNYRDIDSATLFIIKMKAAWNQKKSRDKSNGRKAYSFVMDTKIAAKLKEISGDNPLYQTLEELIEQGFVLNKNEAILLEIEKQQKKLDSTSEKADRLLRANQKRLQDQLNYQKEVAKLRLDLIKGLLLENCTNEILLERHALTDKLPSLEEQELALKNRDKQLEFYEETIKADIDKSITFGSNAFKKEN
jgi:hypothetical protein